MKDMIDRESVNWPQQRVERQFNFEVQQTLRQVLMFDIKRPSCKYFSGDQLLECAVNPARIMDDDCSEFERA